MNLTNSTRMLTINEAAERVPGLSKWRIREMCISGELPHLKAGKKYLINEQVLIGYLSPTQACDNMPWQETAKYVRQLSKQNINIFRSIISFHRPDAEELGLLTQQDWREYAEQHIRTLAEKNNIDIANLGWCGAYHNEGEHPHLHIVFWDKTQKIAKTYVPPKIANDIRIALIKSTFEDKIKALYERKKLAKQNIGESYDNAVLDFDTYMKTCPPEFLYL